MAEYDPSGAAYRGWNGPRYGYRPSHGYGYVEWRQDELRSHDARDPRVTHGYYEDPEGHLLVFDHTPERSHAGRGPKGYRRSDERIREDVCERLCDDPDIDASDVEVRVEQGEVTLTGTVPTRDEKRRSEDTAEVTGVQNVRNLLRVSATQAVVLTGAAGPTRPPGSDGSSRA